jgi:hypothetical protein
VVKETRRRQLPLYATAQECAELKALSQRTRIPQQAFLREALADLLAKYKEELRHEAG